MEIIITLIILGLVFYFIEMIPMAPPFAQIIKVVAIITGVVVVLQWLGINTGLPHIGLR
jgi:hypothetical protein